MRPRPRMEEFEDYDEYRDAVQNWQLENMAEQNEARTFRAVSNALKGAQGRPAIDPDLLALGSKKPEDRRIGAQMLRERQILEGQLRRAAELEAEGKHREAAEAKQRAASYQKSINSTHQTHRYEFQKEADNALLDRAEAELQEAANWPAERVEANREYLEGLANTYNAESDRPHSFHINKESVYNPERPKDARVIRIEHHGHRAADMFRAAHDHNTEMLDHVLRKGFGLESGQEKAEAEEQKFSQAEWESNLKPYNPQ